MPLSLCLFLFLPRKKKLVFLVTDESLNAWRVFFSDTLSNPFVKSYFTRQKLLNPIKINTVFLSQYMLPIHDSLKAEKNCSSLKKSALIHEKRFQRSEEPFIGYSVYNHEIDYSAVSLIHPQLRSFHHRRGYLSSTNQTETHINLCPHHLWMISLLESPLRNRPPSRCSPLLFRGASSVICCIYNIHTTL